MFFGNVGSDHLCDLVVEFLDIGATQQYKSIIISFVRISAFQSIYFSHLQYGLELLSILQVFAL